MDVKYVLSVSGILVFLCSNLHSASCHYQGSEIGTFVHEDSTQLEAMGTIYAVDKSRIFIKSFTFDGNQFGRDIHFFAGRSDAAGVIIPDEMGTTESLGMYFQHDVLLVLPSGQEIANFSWIAIWDVMHEVHYGYVNISCQFKPPDRRELGDFSFTKLGCKFHVDNVVIENIKQVTFIGVVYDHWKSGFSIYAGNGSPESTEWKIELLNKDEDSKLSFKPGVNLTMTLPDDLTVFEIDFIGVWVQPEVGKNFNVITITDQDRENLPPYIPNTTETKRCEVLLGDMYQVSWQLDKPNNQITLELSGRVASNEYMAFGISRSVTRTQMVGSDVTVVWIDPSTNEPEAEDYHMSANTQCVVNSGFGACPDTFSSEGSNDVHLVGAVIRHGVTTITVERPLKSDDPLDKPIPTDEQVYTFWSLGTINNVGLVAHHHHSAAGDLEINFGTSGRSFCTEFLALDKDEKDNTSTKNRSPMLYDTSSFTGRHISKRNVGSPDPLALIVADACCFFMCQNGGVGFFTADQQSRCVCPSPFTGDLCQQGRDLCDPNPCQNSGSCILLQTFLCICAPGFTGTTCDLIAGGPFTVVCPADVLVLTLAGTSQTAAATWREPDAPGYQFIQSSHAPGDEFPIGETSVDYLFTTSQGFQTCTFCVTVQEVTLTQPTVNDCVNVEAFTLQDRMAVQFMEPTAADGCGSVLLFSATARSGDFFPVGQTAVTFSFSDSCGNIAVCNFVVTVNNVVDVTPPSITNCPTNIVQVTTSMSSFVVVMWDELIVEDVSQPIQQIEGPDGFTAVFLLGTTTTVNYAYQDSVGNIGRCAFDVTIRFTLDATPPDCGNILPELTECVNPGANSVIIALPQPSCSDDSGTGRILFRSPSSNEFSLGNTTVNFTCTDDSGNRAHCLTRVSVIQANVPCNSFPCMNDGFCISMGTEFLCTCQPGFIGNRCEEVQTPCSPNPCLNAGSCVITGVNEFSCVCPSGFIGQICNQMVGVMQTITCPDDIYLLTNGGGAEAVVSWIEPAGSVLFQSHRPGDLFPVGETSVTYVILDSATRIITCEFRVLHQTVDVEPPTVSNVRDVTINVTAVGAAVEFEEPTAEDALSVAYLVSASHRSGDVLPIGSTVVNNTFSDRCGNTVVVTFVVTVELLGNNTPPSPPICPNIQPVTSFQGDFGQFVTWGDIGSCFDSEDGSVTPECNERNGDLFPVGQTTVRCTCTDSAGATSECDFTIQVNPVNTPPSPPNCPNNIQPVTSFQGNFGQFVTWEDIGSCFDSEDGSITPECNEQSGDLFSVGQTTVRCTCTDSAGATSECDFTIQVNPVNTPPPPPTCPNIQPVTSFQGNVGQIVTWDIGSCLDSEDGSITPECNRQSGAFFPVGQTTVRCTCTDSAGATSECDFTIQVDPVNTPPPPPTCPNIQPVTSFQGNVGQIVTWDIGSCLDSEDGSITPECNHQSGDLFPVGQTTVRCTCTDSVGALSECDFSFTVQVFGVGNNTPPSPPTCPNIQPVTSFQGDFGQFVTWEDIGSCFDSEDGSITPECNQQSGDLFPVGQTTVRCTCTDSAGALSECDFSFTVQVFGEDTVPPTISGCPNDLSVHIELGTPTAVVRWTEPTATDLSGTVIMTSRSKGPGESFLIGLTTVVYIFSDASGNAASCSFVVTVITVDTVPPTISGCPNHLSVEAELGSATAVVGWTEPTATDISGTVIMTSRSNRPGESFSVGRTDVVYIFSDASGNAASCIFFVTVFYASFNFPPSPPICPNVQPVTSFQGDFGQFVTWEDIGSCVDLTEGSITPECNQQSGDLFPVGQTTVRCTCTDSAGALSECNFSFTVQVFSVENIPPVVSCINDITLGIPLNSVGVVAEFTEPTATDNSGTASVLSATRRPGQFFQTGTTTVTYIFADPSGNTADCVFDIIVVEDTIPPVFLSCPNDMILNILPTAFAGFHINIPWMEPTYDDEGGTIRANQTHSPGDSFRVGDITNVVYTIVDLAGNAATCEFLISLQTTARRKRDVDITFTKHETEACPCLNGVCLNVEDGRTSFCHCPEEYSGMLCEVDQTDRNDVDFNRQLPFVAVVGGLVIIIGILAIALCQVSKNLFKQNQMVKEDEVAIIN